MKVFYKHRWPSSDNWEGDGSLMVFKRFMKSCIKKNWVTKMQTPKGLTNTEFRPHKWQENPRLTILITKETPAQNFRLFHEAPQLHIFMRRKLYDPAFSSTRKPENKNDEGGAFLTDNSRKTQKLPFFRSWRFKTFLLAQASMNALFYSLS